MKPVATLTALLLAASPVVAQQVLNLRNADIRAFIQDAARVTGRTFIIDPRVQGKVSVVTERALSRTEYFELFLSTLRANGLVAVPAAGGAFRVQPVDAAAAGRVGTRGASGNSFVTEVFRLQTIDATSAVETLRPLVSREGSVTANRSGNAVVVADYADNIRRVRNLLARIDRDSAATRLVPVKNAGAREIAASLQQLIGSGGEGARSGVSVVAIDSANAIALRGDALSVARLAAMAQDLDRRAASGNEIRVIFLEHADAEKLLPVLQQLVGQQGPAPVPTPAANGAAGSTGSPASAPAVSSSSSGRGSAVIARYEGANAIVIAGSADVQRMLGQVVRQLDTRREQVLVEAIIVEISDNAAKKLGVQFLLGGLPGSGVPFAATNYSNAAPNILTIGGAIGARELNTTTTVVNGNSVTTTTNNAVSDQLAQAAVNSILGAGGAFGGFAGRIIRDRETAEIAVQASLTGHLVLSTVHTNDAAGAITRLRDMRIEPFLLASTLRAVIAQRLVRRLCSHCATPVAPPPSIVAALDLPADAMLRGARGCDRCDRTGYRGRIGLFEAIRVDDAIRAMIHAKAEDTAIAAHAFAMSPDLRAAARQLALDGVTSADEIVRILHGNAADA